jgi:hypothetical protein
MVTLELLVRLEAKPGKKAEVECFLCGGLSVVQEELATTALFAIRLGPATRGSFDPFPDDAGLRAKAAELFARPLTIEKVDILATELPG